MSTFSDISEFNENRDAHALPGQLPIEPTLTRICHVICPGVCKIGFPLVVPDLLCLYGPIVLDTTPIENSDPKLNL